MNFWNFVFRNGIWISIPLFGLAVMMLAFFIMSLVRLEKKMQLVTVPLRENQEIEFAKDGAVDLCVEGPLLTERFADLNYELLALDGRRITGRTTWFHARTTGFSRTRMAMRAFAIPSPGRYVLQITGLQDNYPVDAEHRIVFTRPHLVLTVGHILGIILSAGLTIGSLVLFILRIGAKGAQS